MKKSFVLKISSLISLAAILAACGGDGGGSASNVSEGGSSCSLPLTAASGPVSGPNVLTVGVGTTSLCGSNFNIPCTSVTICEPGTTHCQTISDILIDTGSYGLRVFSQAISLNLPAITDNSGNPLAECAQFGSAVDWGSVVSGDVVLGGESAVTVPIQVINNSFGTSSLPPVCSSAETGPSQAGINGLLGVGLMAQDCGTQCINNSGSAGYNMYYSCKDGTCNPATAQLAKQVTNPVSALPIDNNGVILSMPAVQPGGTSSVTGSLILGIDTAPNNSSAGFARYQANSNGFFSTNFSGQKLTQSFIDSGSNGYFLPNPGWNECGGFYCTGEYTANTATVEAALGPASAPVCFSIGDATTLFNSGNAALSDIGADVGFSTSFDWGLPFFYGRSVLVGLEGKGSNLGIGPYWAF